MTVKVRFAPSPTGYLHVGNVRTALINWLFARKYDGHFLLRMDDTDLERSKPAYELAILEDMEWLGLTHDSFFKQSERFNRYKEIMDKLILMERLYPCYETSEELEFKRKRQLGRGEPPRYDRAALKLTKEERSTFEREGRKPHYRFLLEDKDVSWHDLIRGTTHFGPGTLSDPVLVRADSAYLYTLTSVVDDVDTSITHILRGEDHVTNTAVQVQLFEALGRDPSTIRFGHTTLLMEKGGGSLSKRLGSLSIGQLRHQGLEPTAICSLLARLGTSLPVRPVLSLCKIVELFDLETFSRNPPQFDLDELKELNHKIIAMMPFDQIYPKLLAKGFSDFSEAEWDLFKGNIGSDEDFKLWHDIFHSEIKVPTGIEKDSIQKALEYLPKEPFTQETWSKWMGVLKEKTGRKGKQLFMPLRQALTGRDHGPEMKDILPLLGYNKVKKRLEAVCTEEDICNLLDTNCETFILGKKTS